MSTTSRPFIEDPLRRCADQLCDLVAFPFTRYSIIEGFAQDDIHVEGGHVIHFDAPTTYKEACRRANQWLNTSARVKIFTENKDATHFTSIADMVQYQTERGVMKDGIARMGDLLGERTLLMACELEVGSDEKRALILCLCAD